MDDPTHPAIQKAYTALVCGNGRVLPIVESIGRRVIREIDPDSREGRELLESGQVAIWSDDAHRARRVPLAVILKEMKTRAIPMTKPPAIRPAGSARAKRPSRRKA